MWFKIDKKYYNAADISFQYNIDFDGRKSIDIEILTNDDMSINSLQNLIYNQRSKFVLETIKYIAYGCFIRQISLTETDNGQFTGISIICDYVKEDELSDRRNRIIEEILK